VIQAMLITECTGMLLQPRHRGAQTNKFNAFRYLPIEHEQRQDGVVRRNALPLPVWLAAPKEERWLGFSLCLTSFVLLMRRDFGLGSARMNQMLLSLRVPSA
jgi:hypothetical protein